MTKLRDDLFWLAHEAEQRAEECSRRGDVEGDFYARGLRDAYATAAAAVGREVSR